MDSWHLEGELTFSVGQHSVAGKKEENEDAIGIRIPTGMLLNTKGAVAVIADGVSAAEAGKEASQTSVTSFLSDYYSTPDSWSVRKSSARVITALNRWLYGKSGEYFNAQRGYVCTFSCIVFKSHSAYIFHVGDTRIYRLRNGELEQLTRDHATRINSEKTYLTRALGLDVKLDVDYQTVETEVGDLFLLTSDGVHDFVNHTTIAETINTADALCRTDQTNNSGSNPLEEACETLSQIALKNNSGDNLSCQILRIDSLPSQNANDVFQKLVQLNFPPHLEKGMKIDGYLVQKEIHSSSRSQLYIVEEIDSGKYFCMKTPSINFEDDPAYIERFILESWVGSRIQSSNVVKVINTQQKKSFLYYLTEYVEGITLEQWINENPKPAVQDAIYLVEQIAKGIRALHRKEILHQDIKPGNVLIDRNGQAKIVDFGSCQTQGIAEISTPIDRENNLGTASYSAPELVLGKAANSQADIFSLGVIVFEMLTGEPPFSGKLEECRTQQAYIKTKYIPSYEINPLVPVWIDGAIKKALRFDPNRRYGDVSEFIHELTTPNPKYKKYHSGPILVKNPLLFWQLSTLVLFIALLASLLT